MCECVVFVVGVFVGGGQGYVHEEIVGGKGMDMMSVAHPSWVGLVEIVGVRYAYLFFFYTLVYAGLKKDS